MTKCMSLLLPTIKKSGATKCYSYQELNLTPLQWCKNALPLYYLSDQLKYSPVQLIEHI